MLSHHTLTADHGRFRLFVSSSQRSYTPDAIVILRHYHTITSPLTMEAFVILPHYHSAVYMHR